MLHRGEEDKSDCAIGVVVSAGIVRTDTKKKSFESYSNVQVGYSQWGVVDDNFFPPENEKKNNKMLEKLMYHPSTSICLLSKMNLYYWLQL